MLDIYLCGDFGPEREKIQKQIEKKIRIHGTILWMNVWRLWIKGYPLVCGMFIPYAAAIVYDIFRWNGSYFLRQLSNRIM